MKFRTFLLALIVATFFIGVSAPKAHAEGPTFYGGLIADLYYKSADKDAGDDADTILDFNGALSKVGLKGKAGNTSYVVELGLKGKNSSDTVYVRQAYAKVAVGPGTLLAGQTYSKSFNLGTALYGTTVLAGSVYGTMYGGRIPQVRFEAMGAYLALIQPSTTITGLGTATDQTLPKLAVGYDGKAGPLGFGLGFGYNSTKIDDVGAALEGESVTSYIAFLRVKYNAGAIGFKAQFGYAQNIGNYFANYPFKGSNVAVANIAEVDATDNTKINDTTGFGFIAVVSYNFGSGVFELGGGYQSAKNDNHLDTTASMQAYAQVKIGLDKHFFIVPGFYYQDNMKSNAGVTLGKTQYYGLGFVGTF